MNNTKKLKIGIFGTGHIGKTLALKLAAAGHDVKVANSRGPETIEPTCWLPARARSRRPKPFRTSMWSSSPSP